MTSFETNARGGVDADMRIGSSMGGEAYAMHGNLSGGKVDRGDDAQVNKESVGSAAGTAEGDNAKGGRITPTDKLAVDLAAYNKLANSLRANFEPRGGFEDRCRQAFEVANELFLNAPTWVCFYRALMGGKGFILSLFPGDEEFGAFLRTDEYHEIQLMLTALRSRDLPENDPNDPQRMITVRLPKSLHEAMCEEAGRLNISVNRLCISRMLQLLDPAMIPETRSKPRGRKPRLRTRSERTS
jgi:hypothetical protein